MLLLLTRESTCCGHWTMRPDSLLAWKCPGIVLAVSLSRPRFWRRAGSVHTLSAGVGVGISQREPIYKEDTFNRDADRREIVRLLVGNDVKSKDRIRLYANDIRM
jgi:hypothetical protein